MEHIKRWTKEDSEKLEKEFLKQKEEVENSKYYKPDLTDFYIGFECEVLKDKWRFWDTSEFDTLGITNDISRYKIRVKFLDDQDIQSLGWNPIKLFTESGVDNFLYRNKDVEANLSFSHKDKLNIGIICKYLHGPNSYSLTNGFRGYIKNKSELKKLMEQLKIK